MRMSSGSFGCRMGSVQLKRAMPVTSHSDFAFATTAESTAGSMNPVGFLTSFVLPTGHEGQRRLHEPRTSMLKKNRRINRLYKRWRPAPHPYCCAPRLKTQAGSNSYSSNSARQGGQGGVARGDDDGGDRPLDGALGIVPA